MHVTSTRAHPDQCAIKRDHLKRVENVQRTPRTNSVVVSVLLRAQACVYFVVVLGSSSCVCHSHYNRSRLRTNRL